MKLNLLWKSGSKEGPLSSIVASNNQNSRIREICTVFRVIIRKHMIAFVSYLKENQALCYQTDSKIAFKKEDKEHYEIYYIKNSIKYKLLNIYLFILHYVCYVKYYTSKTKYIRLKKSLFLKHFS